MINMKNFVTAMTATAAAAVLKSDEHTKFTHWYLLLARSFCDSVPLLLNLNSGLLRFLRLANLIFL
jgi:hypothetical protein